MDMQSQTGLLPYLSQKRMKGTNSDNMLDKV